MSHLGKTFPKKLAALALVSTFFLRSAQAQAEYGDPSPEIHFTRKGSALEIQAFQADGKPCNTPLVLEKERAQRLAQELSSPKELWRDALLGALGGLGGAMATVLRPSQLRALGTGAPAVAKGMGVALASMTAGAAGGALLHHNNGKNHEDSLSSELNRASALRNGGSWIFYDSKSCQELDELRALAFPAPAVPATAVSTAEAKALPRESIVGPGGMRMDPGGDAADAR